MRFTSLRAAAVVAVIIALFGIEGFNVSALFLLAGAAACLGPAWRATTIDPRLALNAE